MSSKKFFSLSAMLILFGMLGSMARLSAQEMPWMRNRVVPLRFMRTCV